MKQMKAIDVFTYKAPEENETQKKKEKINSHTISTVYTLHTMP